MGVDCTGDILLHFTFIENPDGIIFFGHSKSVVLILLPDSINNMTFVSVLQGLKTFLRSVMCYITYTCQLFLRYKHEFFIMWLNIILGKVKLERVGQRSSPTSVCDLRGGPRGIAGLLVCPFASVALHCSFAC